MFGPKKSAQKNRPFLQAKVILPKTFDFVKRIYAFRRNFFAEARRMHRDPPYHAAKFFPAPEEIPAQSIDKRVKKR